MLFNGPHSIDFSSNDDFYITNYYSSEILVFDDNGFLKKLYNSFLKGPATGFFDTKGNFWISEYRLNRLICINPKKNIILKKYQLINFWIIKLKRDLKDHICVKKILVKILFF